MLSILDTWECDGKWWVPDEEGVIPGTFKWEQKFGTLRLHSSFRKDRYPLAYGKTSANKAITMINAQRSKMQVHVTPMGLGATSSYGGVEVIVGGHISADEKFLGVSAVVPGMELWIKRRPMIPSISGEGKLQLSGDNKSEEIFRLPDFNVRLTMSRVFGESANTEIRIRDRAMLHIDFNAPQPLNTATETLVKATLLFSLLGGFPFAPERIELSSESGSQYEYLIQLNDHIICPARARHEFFLRQEDTPPIQDLLVRWFVDYEKFRMPIALAQSIFSSKSSLADHMQFLSLMQVFEGFHRVEYDGRYMDQTAYDDTIYPLIVAAIPRQGSGLSPVPAEAHRSSLKSRVRFGNEKSLRNRMRELGESLDNDVRARLLGVEGKVPESWLQTRNYYTHWDEANRQGVLEGSEMRRANGTMRLFARCLFLERFGVPPDALINGLNGQHQDTEFMAESFDPLSMPLNPL